MAEPKGVQECETCTLPQQNVQAYCLQCSGVICEECLISHKAMQVFSLHQVVSIADMTQTGEMLGDNYEKSTNNTVPCTKIVLQAKMSALKQFAMQTSQDTEAVQTAKLEVEERAQYSMDMIKSNFDQLHQIIGKTKVNLYREVLQNIQINKTTRDHNKSKRTDLLEKVDFGVEVKCAEALKQLCQTKAKIIQVDLEDAPKWVGDGINTAEVGITAEVSLTTRDKTNVRVVSELKSLSNGSVVKCTVDQSGPGEYNIKYTPTVRGHHKLIVSVNGRQFDFSVSVSSSPTQLGKPVKVWNGIVSPYGVTVNSSGEFVVCELDGDIVKLDKEGGKHVIVNRSASTLSQLSGIATDTNDNIYCIDGDSNKILRCSKNGEILQEYEVQQEKGPGHCGLAVVGDEVMLCERGSKGTIMVYNGQLEYVRRVVHEDMGEFYNLSSDSHGNLYVIDDTKSMIRLFSNDGVLVRSFGRDKNGLNRLKGPHGICVSGQYVYVSNWSSHNVSVFSTTGRYITTFGRFRYPRGVCAHMNHILVCDVQNNRVQCFLWD